MNRLKIYRMILLVCIGINIAGIIVIGYQIFDKSVPNDIKIMVNRLENFNFSLPIEAEIDGENVNVLNIPNGKIKNEEIKLSFNKPFTIQSAQKGSYNIDLKLFGFIKIKEIELDVIEEVELTPCGMPIGIYVETNGVLVLGTGAIACVDGLNYEPSLNVLESGDYITAVNNKLVGSIEDLQREIHKSTGKDIEVTIRRKEQMTKVKIKPVMAVDGIYKIGAWIRDETQGIGTITYVDDHKHFGALGHGITDIDTGLLMEIMNGGIYKADILQIVKGKAGTPGELVGLINLDEKYKIGDILINSNQGIFGSMNNNNKYEKLMKPIPIALKQEIQLGEASILCKIEDRVEEYKVEIEKIDLNSKKDSKGLSLRIIDDELLDKTNGIVQGMSGSPIIQNNKLIGAVTHVFIQDSTKGYGIFIENMLQSSK
jgi:stage IV sporulation protein B